MFSESIERSSAGEIIQFQEELLRKQLLYLASNSPYYSALFKSHSIDIAEIRTLQDLGKIPVTTKAHIQERNTDFFCVGKEKIIDYTTTSGTSGSPITFILTENDLERLAYNEQGSFKCAGLTDKDIIQLTTTVDRCFMAGMAYFLGARKMGAGIVRVGPGIPELQWDMIHRIKPNVLIAVPSFILKLIEYAEHHSIDFQNAGIEKVICIGEAIRNQDFGLNTLGAKIIEKWSVKLFSTYASTEMCTAFTECSHGKGGHHRPELIITELLDEQDQPVKAGEQGELTITTLGVEGMPLLRYKTGDICTIHEEPCACGRSTMRISPIIGRKNQMIKYKGTSIYPIALNNILNGVEGIKRYITEVKTNAIGTDELIMHIIYEGKETDIEHTLKSRFRAIWRVVPVINFCSEKQLESLIPGSYSRKPIDFIDNRN